MTNYHLVILAGLGVEGRTMGPSNLKHVAKKHGYNIKIVNFIDQNPELLPEVVDKYVNENTILGISTTYLPKILPDNIKRVVEIIRTLKKTKKFKILLGGPSPKLSSELFGADFVISGYAEHTLIEFLNKEFNHGISKSLYKWDIINSDHVWDDDDHIQPNETLPLEIGRGCIFKCKFCRFEFIGKKKGEYVRDMDLIKNELIYNYEKFKVVNYMIMDDTFNDDIYKLDIWNNMVSSLPFKIKYTAYLRADLLHRYQSMASDLYSTGLNGGTFGIESLHPEASKTIGKAWSGKQAKEFMPKLINEIFQGKFLSKLNFIAGLPYETTDDIINTMQWLVKNNFHSASFLPLVIMPNLDETQSSSEFDREYKKYQFTVSDNGEWISPWMDRKTAVKLCDRWFSTNDTKFGGFQAFAKLPFTSFENLLNYNKKKILNSEEYNSNKFSFYNNYFNQLLI